MKTDWISTLKEITQRKLMHIPVSQAFTSVVVQLVAVVALKGHIGRLAVSPQTIALQEVPWSESERKY